MRIETADEEREDLADVVISGRERDRGVRVIDVESVATLPRPHGDLIYARRVVELENGRRHVALALVTRDERGMRLRVQIGRDELRALQLACERVLERAHTDERRARG